MFDKFAKVLQSGNKSLSKFRVAASTLRLEASPKNYPTLISRIRKIYPKYAAHILLPYHREKWANLKYVNSLNPALNLRDELTWQVIQLKEYTDKINEHILLLGKFVEAINSNNIDDAYRLLDQHFQNHGATLWNIEARFLLTSRGSNGDADVDELLLQLKSDLDGSLAYLAAYIFSVLYDQSTTYSGFSDWIEPLIQRYSGSRIGEYLKVKLLRDSFSSKELASYLAVESGYSYVDAYEGILKVIPESILLDDGDEVAKSLVSVAITLGDIKDIRLHSTSRLLLGEIKHSVCDEAPPFLLNQSHYPSIERIGKVLSGNTEVGSSQLTEVETALSDLLGQLCNERTDVFELYRSLATNISKYRLLPWYIGFESQIHSLFFPLSADHSYLKYIALCAAIPLPKQCELINSTIIPKTLELYESGILALPWLRIYSSNTERCESYFKAVWKTQHNDAAGAIQELDKALLSQNGALHGLYLQKILSLLELNDESAALSLCVKMALTNESVARLLPFEGLVADGKEWADIENFDYIDLAIGLHFASQFGNSKDKFNLKFCCKKMLAANKCKSLANFASKLQKDDRRLTFILWKIFIPTNLKLVSFLRDIEEADNARLEVCQILLDIKKDDVEAILEEIRNIIRRKELRLAEKNIESARIHVSREGIKRWAESKYREQFLRTRKNRLVRVAPTIDELEAGIARHLQVGGVGGADDSIAKNMEDPLFAMGVDILKNCFTKGDDGLEHFLSLRIRHGSMTGYLRAPLERCDLAAQGKLTLQSSLAQYWENKLTCSDKESVKKVIEGLAEFQDSFDTMLEDIRINYIQIHSSKKPKGLFIPGLPKIVWDAFYVDWENSETFDKFFDSAWDAFLIALDNGLGDVKKLISVEVLEQSELLFMRLRGVLDLIELSPADRAVIVNALNQGVTEFQDAARVVMAWFAFKDDSLESTNITFDQLVELALNVFKNARPALRINLIHHSKELEPRFGGTIISKLIDAFFIVLDNVYQHSGLEGEASVDLWSKWSINEDGQGVLEMEFENSLADFLDINVIERNFETVKLLLEKDSNEDIVNNEGGSGLLKLARIAKSHNHLIENPIHFNISEHRKVRIKVSMALSYRATTLYGE